MIQKSKKFLVIFAIFFLTLSAHIFTTLPTAVAAEQVIVISSAFPGEMIKAGDNATFPLTITNRGPICIIDARIHYIPFGEAKEWNIQFKADGRNIHRISIPPGGSRTVTLMVETTGDAPIGEHRLRVTFWDAHIDLFVMVTEMRAGEPGTLEMTVVNKEGEKVRGAVVSVYTDDGKLVDQMMTTARGLISMDLAEGTYDILIERAGYEIRWERDVKIRVGRETNLGIRSLERKPFAAEIRVGTPSKTITAGTRPIFKIIVENLGDYDDSYILRVGELPYGWHARYVVHGTNIEITEAFIRSRKHKNLGLEVIPPYEVEIGEYNLTIEIESSDRLYSETLSLDVRGRVGKHVDFDRYRVEITPGDVASFEVSVRNYGRGVTLTNIRPNVSAPRGWRVDITPRTAASILPGERGVFNVEVIPPGDIVAGEYRLNMVIRSDQAEAEEVEFRVVVEEEIFIMVFGVLILGLVAVGLWIMFKKFGRR